MPSGELFQAVCDEIGHHYTASGFKYSRSRPKISIKDRELKLDITFWSSRSNMPGNHVDLEILPNFYSLELATTGKAKGFLFGHTAIFHHKYTDNPRLQRINQIYGDVLEREDSHTNESVIIDNHHCNIYGIDEFKFKKIIEFVDNKIISWFEKLKTKEGIVQLTDNPPRIAVWSLNGKGGNSVFIEYCRMKFPDLDVEKKLPGA